MLTQYTQFTDFFGGAKVADYAELATWCCKVKCKPDEFCSVFRKDVIYTPPKRPTDKEIMEACQCLDNNYTTENTTAINTTIGFDNVTDGKNTNNWDENNTTNTEKISVVEDAQPETT